MSPPQMSYCHGTPCPWPRPAASSQPGGGTNAHLGVKAPVQAGPGLGDQRRLDADGTAAAEGVAEGVPAPEAGLRVTMAAASVSRRGPPRPRPGSPACTALRRWHPGRWTPVLEHRKAHLVFRPVLRELLQAVVGLQPLHHGLLMMTDRRARSAAGRRWSSPSPGRPRPGADTPPRGWRARPETAPQAPGREPAQHQGDDPAPQRRLMFSRASPDSWPRHSTRPFSTCTSSGPSRRISSPTNFPAPAGRAP